MNLHPSLLLASLLLQGACTDTDTSDPPAPGAGGALGASGGPGAAGAGAGGAGPGSGGAGPATSVLVGDWYGTGPDGDQCITVCANGKVFTGDRPCTDVEAGDFASYLASTTSGTSLVVSGSAECWLSGSSCGSPATIGWSIEGASALVSWCGAELQLDRVGAPNPALCDDPARGPC